MSTSRRCFGILFLLSFLLLITPRLAHAHKLAPPPPVPPSATAAADALYGRDEPPLVSTLSVPTALARDARGSPVIYWVQAGVPFELAYGFERHACCHDCRVTFTIDVPPDGLEQVAGTRQSRSTAPQAQAGLTLRAAAGRYTLVTRARLHEGEAWAERAIHVIAVDSARDAHAQAVAPRPMHPPVILSLQDASSAAQRTARQITAPENYARIRGLVATYPHPSDHDRRYMLRGVRVRLYRADGTLIDTVYTVEATGDPDGGINQENLSYVEGNIYHKVNDDDSGAFDFGDVYVGPAGDDLYFGVEFAFHAGGDGVSAAGDERIVIQDADGRTVIMEWNPMHFDSGADGYVLLAPPDLDGNDPGIMDKAAHAYLDMTKSFAYYRDKGGYTPTWTAAQIDWSDTRGSPHHKGNSGLIYLPRASTDFLVYTATHTIVHEYAHAVHWRILGEQMPPYDRCGKRCVKATDGHVCPVTTGKDAGDCNHGNCNNATAVDAIIEGWARFAPTAILRDQEIRWGASNSTTDLDSRHQSCSAVEQNDRSEWNMGATFYDLHQSPGYDGHTQFHHILQVLGQAATGDSHAFFTNYRGAYPSQCYALWRAFDVNIGSDTYHNDRCTKPGPPTGLNAQPHEQTDVSISWHVTDPRLYEHVHLQISRNGGAPWRTLMVSPNDPQTQDYSYSYDIPTEDCETRMWFRVQAERADGIWSDPSAAVSFDGVACPDPATPSSLVATMAGPTAIALTWQDNASDEQYFEVSRRAQDAATWEVVGTPVADSESWTDPDVSCGTRYAYRVRARGLGSAWSAYSYPDSARTNLCAAAHLADGLGAHDVAWGDYDSDGDLDLAVATAAGNHVYANDGAGWTGALSLAWSADESDSGWAAAWGDYDGDGDLDLAFGNVATPDRLYRNDGGAWTLAWSSPTSAATTEVAWADYDGDGDLDLFAARDGAANQLYRNDGGALGLNPAWSDPATDTRSQGIAWADYDGDGDLDVAVANAHNQPNAVYENDGGTLRLDPAAGWGWQSDDALWSQAVAWGDYDHDGDLDLAVANEAQVDQVWENDGSGDLRLDPAAGWGWQSDVTDRSLDVAWGDYDSDGDLDLAVAHGTTAGSPNPNSYNRVYENDRGELYLAWTSDRAENTFGLAWGDWDGDGGLDLVFANSDAASRMHESAHGPLPDSPLWQESGGGDGTSSIDWGDYDGDGDLDLAVGRSLMPGPVYRARPDAVLENQNGLLHLNPEVGLGWTLDHEHQTTDIAWGDADGDGDLDLVTTDLWGSLYMYANDGAGGLTLHLTMTLGTRTPDRPAFGTPGTLAWTDYDGDGDLDLAHAAQGVVLRVLENDGDGHWQVGWTSPDPEQVDSLAWGDADGDGDPDLAVANYLSPNALYRNDGAGTLTRAWQDDCTDDCTWTSSLAWGDYDGDGDLDLAFGHYLDDPPSFQTPQLYENVFSDGDGTYLRSDPVSAGPPPWPVTALAWGDWDGDGDPDLAAGTSEAGPALVYENIYGGYGGYFDPLEILPALGWGWMGKRELNTADVAWVDVDGDGDLDLTLGNRFAYGIASSWPGPIQVFYAALAPQTAWHNDGLPNNRTTVRVADPGASAKGEGLVGPLPARRATIPVHFWLADPEGDPVEQVMVQYTLDGGSGPGTDARWHTATPASDDPLTDLTASPSGTRHTFLWDAAADAWTAADAARVRVLIVQNSATPAGSIPWPAMAATSAPFRIARPAIYADQRVITDAGETLYFTHDVTNLSEDEERTCYFSAVSPRGWTVDFPDGASMTLAPGEWRASALPVQVHVPQNPAASLPDPHYEDTPRPVQEVIRIYATCYPGGDRSWLDYDIWASPAAGALYLPLVLKN